MRYTPLYILIFFFFITCAPKTTKESSILDLIPTNASIVFKINDFESLKNELTTNEILKGLETSDIFVKISKKIIPLKLLKGQKKGVLAFTEHDSTDFHFTYITLDSLSLNNWDENSNHTIDSLSLDNSGIITYQIDKELYYTSFIEGYTVLSSSKTLLENLNDRTTQETIKPSLDKFYMISNSRKLLNIWIDLEHGGHLLHQFLSSENKLVDFASWLSLDLTLTDTEIILNGITQTNTEEKQLLNMFNNNKPMLNNISSVVPSDVHYLKSYTLNDFKVFSKNNDAIELNVSAIDSLLTTVEEIGLTKIGEDKVLFLRTYGTATLLDYFNEQRLVAELNGENEVWELKPSTQFFEPLESLIGKASFKYATLIENTFLFSDRKNVLELTLNKFKNGTVFSNTDLFQNATRELTSTSSIFTVSDLQGTVELLQESGSGTFAKTVGESGLKDYVFSSQFIADDGFFHSNFLIKKITVESEKNTVTSAFKVQFNTDLATLPQFTINHTNSKKEILVQDQENVLYLITNTGKVLWKKQLDGTIQGKVHQVDLYKNGKLQLAFTTNNEFLILDRNGKEVAPFSMKFEGGNLNPLAVFDYEGKRDYRFLVTQNERVFMYNRDGKIVKGFRYPTAEASILEAPQHFRIGKKDFLIFKLANGQLKILNRVGSTRVAVKEKYSFSENPVTPYQNKFTFTSTAGLLYQIDTNGAVTQSNQNLQKDHGMDATSKTLAIMNDNMLRIRAKKIELELGVYSKPIIFYLNDKIYVSVTDLQNQKVYLFDSQAEAISGFPIFGSSIIDMADIDNDQKPEVVLKDQENTIAVYTIN